MRYCKVYFSDVEPLKDKTIFDRFFSGMSRKRKDKINSFRFEKDKMLSLGAGILLKKALGDAGIDANEDNFFLNGNGKPFLPSDTGTFFNLSHSGSKIMCVISDKEVGCDVEKAVSGSIRIAKRFFSGSEYDYLSSLQSEEEKEAAFCRLWTLKESYIKAVGTGLSVPLNSFSIDISDRGVSRIQSIGGRQFGFMEFNPADGYSYSICICDDDGSTDIEQIRTEIENMY